MLTVESQTSEQQQHLQPLDSVLNALEASSCTWCQGMLRVLRVHLEEFIPVEPAMASREA